MKDIESDMNKLEEVKPESPLKKGEEHSLVAQSQLDK